MFRPPRRNRVKVVLLMDVGGSMDPHAELVSRLFTAASRSGRFAKFRSYYFHNCVYDSVYEDAQFRKAVPVADLLANSDRDEKLVLVGDALMHPAELLDPGGSMYLYSQNRASGIEWLRRLAAALPQRGVAQPRARAVLVGHDDRGDRERVRRCGRSRSTAWPRRCATSCAAASGRASATRASGSRRSAS